MLKQEVADKLKEFIDPMEVKRILEIGTGWTESANYFHKLKPSAKIYTVDSFGLYGDGRIYSMFTHEAIKKIQESLPPNCIQILGDSSRIPWELPIDVLFIDGDHTYEGCGNDFLNYYPYVNSRGLIIFDDYHQENNPNNGVKKVVELMLNKFSDDLEIIYEGYYCAILRRK